MKTIKRGFSLVELLVVIVIIGIISVSIIFNFKSDKNLEKMSDKTFLKVLNHLQQQEKTSQIHIQNQGYCIEINTINTNSPTQKISFTWENEFYKTVPVKEQIINLPATNNTALLLSEKHHIQLKYDSVSNLWSINLLR